MQNMTDQNLNDFQPPVEPGQTPPQPSAAPAPGGAAGTNQNADLIQAMETRLQQMEERLSRQVQGKVDKGIDQISKSVRSQLDDLNDRVAALKAAGITVDPAAIQARQREIQQQALQTQASGAAPAQVQPSEPTDPAVIAELNRVAIEQSKVIAKYEFRLESNDPEVQDWDPSQYASPKEWFADWSKKMDQKAERLRSVTNPGVNVPLTGGNNLGPGNPIENITDPNELLKMGLANMP
jgi:uncharacterized coiled-coil protein SlyX